MYMLYTFIVSRYIHQYWQNSVIQLYVFTGPPEPKKG